MMCVLVMHGIYGIYCTVHCLQCMLYKYHHYTKLYRIYCCGILSVKHIDSCTLQGADKGFLKLVGANDQYSQIVFAPYVA